MSKIMKRLAVSFAMFCVISLTIPVLTARAAGGIPAAADNLNVGLRSSSELVATDEGYMRVYYDGGKIGIEYYDDDFNIQSKRNLKMELNVWGGFYAGSDAYYLVEGQINRDENDAAEVIRVIQYDTDWNKTGTANITSKPELFGGEVRDPFDYGCVEMAEHNGTLYIVTGHEGYVDPAYNQGHQGFLMIAVDKASMMGEIVDSDLWHSFAQYIVCKDSDLYVLEQSEGSRYTKLSKSDAENMRGTSLPVLKYGGDRTSAWAISCYASVDGMAVSSDNVFCLGTSIDQSQYDSVSSDTAHNIYLTVTPTENFSEDATTVKWLTKYTGGGKSFLGTKITKINDDRFMVSWEESLESQTADTDDSLSDSVLHYVFLDGSGNVVSEEFTAGAPISDCQPIVKGSKIVYYASNANMVNFYSIDARTGTFAKKIYRVAGENATWKVDNGVLTISGTGAISVDTQANRRYPVSSVGGSVITLSDNAWKQVREYVNKIVIDKGITEIPERAFAYFDNLTEAEIKPGLTSIGKEAFYSCDRLSKITIPASVTSIGEDFLWTGAYWIFDESHVVYAKICAPEGSYAAKYAKENGISYVASDDSGTHTGIGAGGNQSGNTGNSQGDNTEDGTGNGQIGNISILQAGIGGIKKNYVYNGRAQTPNVVVKMGGKILKKGVDYDISYMNNRKTGKASVIIKGINTYNGMVVKTFHIVPKKMAKVKLKSLKKGKIKITWKKDSQADGYQIQYAGNTKFTKNKKSVNITKKSTFSKKISKPAKGKKYYVRIRAYKKIDGKKCYGSWSKIAKGKSK